MTWDYALSGLKPSVSFVSRGDAPGFYIMPFQGYEPNIPFTSQGDALGYYIAPFQGLLPNQMPHLGLILIKELSLLHYTLITCVS